MNLILLFPDDMESDGRARLSGRRLAHVRDVHRAEVGDELAVGLLGGRIGTGTVVRLDDTVLEMDVRLERDPPVALPITVVLALPRPKVLRRVLYSLSVLGVKRIILVNAARVEKSYWQSPFLAPEEIRRQSILGLEQGRDTALPEVMLRPRFKPFVEDELPALLPGAAAFAAHPAADSAFPREVPVPVILAVGPEGGFVPYEIDMLISRGFRAVSLGARALNVETAVSALVGRLLT